MHFWFSSIMSLCSVAKDVLSSLISRHKHNDFNAANWNNSTSENMLYMHYKVNKNVIFYLHCLFRVDLLLCVALLYFYSDFFLYQYLPKWNKVVKRVQNWFCSKFHKWNILHFNVFISVIYVFLWLILCSRCWIGVLVCLSLKKEKTWSIGLTFEQ